MDFLDRTYLASDTDDTDNSLIYDFEEGELLSSNDEDNLPNYTPRPFPDDHVPFSENIYLRKSKKVSPATIAQLQISELFNRNKASIAMHDKLIDIINAYVESVQPPPTAKLLHCWQFLDKMEKSFNTLDLKPTYGSVRLSTSNNRMVTVPVFDMKAMILSIVHNERLMRQENFAPGLDIFTGAVDRGYKENNNYGKFHTGDAWKPAVKRIVGTSKKYMPLGLVVFGDKSHTDQHGTLSLTPVTFTVTFFNHAMRNNPDAWRPMGYIPNLTHANVGGTKSSTKSQSEHYCIAYVLKSLIELSKGGGLEQKLWENRFTSNPSFICSLVILRDTTNGSVITTVANQVLVDRIAIVTAHLRICRIQTQHVSIPEQSNFVGH